MAAYERIFDGGELSGFLQWLQQQAEELLRKIPQDQFMNALPEDIKEYLVSQVTLEPLTIVMEQADVTAQETVVDTSHPRMRYPFQGAGSMRVNATTLIISVPFRGDRRLWQYRPDTSPLEHPQARLTGDDLLAGKLEIQSTQFADQPPENFVAWKNNILSIVGRYLDNQHRDVTRFNANLPLYISQLVSGRRKRLQQNAGLQDLLGIPLRRNPDAPSIIPVQMPRRLVRPLPPPPKSGYQPEPGIEEGEYQHILSVIRHEGRSFEATPETFSKLEEEELRSVILAHLNGHYQGSATGETFRGNGKTDIRIEDHNRAAFVAECKVWKGQKEFSTAIDQLLGYLTWRDCKAALVVFNKHNAKFSRILEALPRVLTTHPLYRTTTQVNEQGEWQCRMTSAADEGRQLIVHVFVFDLFVK